MRRYQNVEGERDSFVCVRARSQTKVDGIADVCDGLRTNLMFNGLNII